MIFKNPEVLNDFLSDTGIIIGEIDPKAYVIAAKRWETYNKRRTLICQTIRELAGWLTHEEADELRQSTAVFSQINAGDWE